MTLSQGDNIVLNNKAKVLVLWCNKDLMQVRYSDLTTRLLKISQYEITKE